MSSNELGLLISLGFAAFFSIGGFIGFYLNERWFADGKGNIGVMPDWGLFNIIIWPIYYIHVIRLISDRKNLEK